MTPEQIIEEIIRREGGYVDHPADRGGPTNWGITIKTLSEWRGTQQTAADVQALTRDEAARIYLAEYVTRPRFGEIADAALRELVIDTGVLHGRARAGRWVQETLNRHFGTRLKVDGAVGPLTLAATNAAPARPLFARLLIRRLQGFADLVQADPRQLVFLEGWVVRAGHFALKLV
jgi:lysozyme family protein